MTRRFPPLLLVALAAFTPGTACAQPAGRLEFTTSSIPVGRQPADVAIGDVDGDRNPDVVTANGGSRDLSVLLGDGLGGFRPAPGSPIGLGFPAHLVVVADFDRDGKADLAVTEHDSNDVVLLRGAGGGRFSRMAGSPVRAIDGVAPHNHGLAAADFDGNGAPDLATSNNNGNSVSVLLGDGRGAFRPAPGSPFRVGRAPYPLTIADFDGDGDSDIATPDVNGHTISVLSGNGRGSFAPSPGSPYRVDERPFFALAADLNGDRSADFVVSHDDSDRLTILMNDGKGRFRPARPVDVGGRTWKVAVADADGDGRNDLVMGRAPSSIVILLGDGSGGFRPSRGSPFPVGRGPWRIALGDLNADGRMDVVTTAGEGDHVSVLLSRGVSRREVR